MVYILMGVSGCGKTTVGEMLARELALPFYDGDDFHPQANIDKMKRLVPLADEDRRPWLAALAGKIAEVNAGGQGAVLACSALKEQYRRTLSGSGEEGVLFIFLKGSRSVIMDRMKERKGHFMPPGLLDDQFSTLEEPAGALTVSIDRGPEFVCMEIIAGLVERGLLEQPPGVPSKKAIHGGTGTRGE